MEQYTRRGVAPVNGLVTEFRAGHSRPAEVLSISTSILSIRRRHNSNPFGVFQVERDPFLAAIQPQEEVRHAAGERRAPAAAHVAIAGFELEHFSAVVGQQQRAVGPGQGVGKIQDAHPVQRTAGGGGGRSG
jgi:hypothetical protein